MIKNIMRLAALALALATFGMAVQAEIPIPDCSICDGSGN